MKSTIQRVLVAVAVATLAAGAVGTASAQTTSPAPGTSPPQRMHRGQFRRFGGSPFLSSLLRATRQLNLTPDQQTSIKSIMASTRHTHQPGIQPQQPGMTVALQQCPHFPCEIDADQCFRGWGPYISRRYPDR